MGVDVAARDEGRPSDKVRSGIVRGPGGAGDVKEAVGSVYSKAL